MGCEKDLAMMILSVYQSVLFADSSYIAGMKVGCSLESPSP